jgi:hypothetical protein
VLSEIIPETETVLFSELPEFPGSSRIGGASSFIHPVKTSATNVTKIKIGFFILIIILLFIDTAN